MAKTMTTTTTTTTMRGRRGRRFLDACFIHAVFLGVFSRCHGYSSPVGEHVRRRTRFVPPFAREATSFTPNLLRNVPRGDFYDEDRYVDIRAVFFSMTGPPSKPGTPAPAVAPAPTTPRPVPTPTPRPVQPEQPGTPAPAVAPAPTTPRPVPTPTPRPVQPEPTVAPVPSPVPATTAPTPGNATTPPPAEPPTRDDRDSAILTKCGVTALERSRDILAELLTVSTATTLVNPETPQFQARDWIDNVDPAIVCSAYPDRIHQRYRLALLYYDLGGGGWTRCNAGFVQQNGTDPEAPPSDCPGVPFLDRKNECEWYGMSCEEGYDPDVAELSDDYYPLQWLEIPSNNLIGTLFDELYGFERLEKLNLQGNQQISGTISRQIGGLTQLQELDLGDNALSGTVPSALFDLPNLVSLSLNDNSLTGGISTDIGNLGNATIVQLQYNSFNGTVPEEGFLSMERLVGLSIQGNELQGSLNALCDVRDERRQEYAEYLTILDADCEGTSPAVECSCCMCF